MDITHKTTGTLLNELNTASLKIQYIGNKPEFVQRWNDLYDALLERGVDFTGHSERWLLIKDDYNALCQVLERLWWAVEDVIKLREADPSDIEAIKNSGYAALKAFELNKQRTDFIQKIDGLLGEARYTFLEKSFK